MNHCANLDAQSADADLNRVYEELLSKLKNDSVATKRLRAAQRAWIVFRDAHLQELYPAEDKQREYGKHISHVLRASECRHYGENGAASQNAGRQRPV
jgi:uncharacterized protein YecT (DUF1311 family)